MTPDGRPWRVVIVDDEPPARRTLRLLIERDPDFIITAECAHGDAAVAEVINTRPDVLFLDVQMPGRLGGFDVLDAIGGSPAPVVVFVTAYDQYALRAFEAHAVDYILKPFTDERFMEALARVKSRLRDRTDTELSHQLVSLLASRANRSRVLVLRDGNRTVVVPCDEIDWIEAEDYCIRIHAGQQQPLIRRSLRSLVDLLDPARFARIHRSAIVNLDRVRQVVPLPTGDYTVILSNGLELRMSRSYRQNIREDSYAR